MKLTKNKIISIVTIAVIVIACTLLMAFKSPDSDAQYIRTNWVEATHGSTLVIESKEELYQYFNENKEKYNLGHKEKVYADTTIGFEDAIADYDEEWFKDHNLVLVLLTAESGSIIHKVNNISVADGTMEINISRKVPDIGTCDMAGWHVLIETDKVSIDEIIVYEEGKLISK